jgi:hypothetical protein
MPFCGDSQTKSKKLIEAKGLSHCDSPFLL